MVGEPPSDPVARAEVYRLMRLVIEHADWVDEKARASGGICGGRRARSTRWRWT